MALEWSPQSSRAAAHLPEREGLEDSFQDGALLAAVEPVNGRHSRTHFGTPLWVSASPEEWQSRRGMSGKQPDDAVGTILCICTALTELAGKVRAHAPLLTKTAPQRLLRKKPCTERVDSKPRASCLLFRSVYQAHIQHTRPEAGTAGWDL